MDPEYQTISEIPTLYKGLEAFSEDDSAIFFGRNEEREQLVYRLQSSRLTILYGGRQVGKTSLIRAGVVPYLRNLRESSKKHSTSGVPELAWVVFDDWSDADVVGRLSIAIDQEVKSLRGKSKGRKKSEQSFMKHGNTWTSSLGGGAGQLFILLDQFEEYLLRNPGRSDNPFDLELPNILTTRGLAVNVLICIRDDVLASLDRYRYKITNLYGSLLRLEPLGEKQACDAILNPVTQFYNPQQKAENKISIEYDLVDAILESVACENCLEGEAAKSEDSTERTFNSSGIQLIMKSLWEWEANRASNKFRVDTFLRDMQGLSGISKSYLNYICSEFTLKEKNLTAKVLDTLITHGGLGLAFPFTELSKRVGAREGEISAVEGVVEKLRQIGLLTVIPLKKDPPLNYYEVKQRILTDAILDKVDECLEKSGKEERKLGIRIMDAKQQFKHDSQLSALKNAIKATDDIEEAISNLSISTEAFKETETSSHPDLKENFRNTLQYMLDNLCQTHQLGGYKGAVSSIVFGRSSGMCLVTGEEDGTVKLWELGTGEMNPFNFPDQHKTWVWAMVSSADGRWLATGSDDGSVSVWSMEGQRPCHSFSILPSDSARTAYPVRGLSFSRHDPLLADPLLAIADNGGEIRLWNLKANAPAGGFKVSRAKEEVPTRCVEFSPDGDCLATGSDDGVVRLWSLDGKCLGEAPGHDAEIWSLSFHPNGQYLASASQDHTIKIWNIKDKSKPAFHETITGHTCCVLSVEFSPDGKLLASASEDGTACLWDLHGNNLAIFTHGGPVNDVAFSPDGAYLATAAADFRVRLWDVEKGKRGRHSEQFRHPGMAILLDVAVSPDGKRLVTGGTDKEAQLWDENGNLLRSFKGHNGIILSVAFAPDGKTFASCGFDKTARLWNLDQDVALAVLAHETLVLSVAYSPDGALIATGTADGVVCLWDWQNRPSALRQSYCGKHGPVWSVLFNPKDASLACGYQDGTIIQWSQGGQQLQEFSGLHEGPVLSLSFNKEGTLLASGASAGRICLWDWGSGKGRVLKRFHAPVWSVAFSPDGQYLATGSLDRSVCILKVEKDGEKKTIFYGQAPVRGIGFGGEAGEEWVAAACSDGTVKLWPLKTDGYKGLLNKAKSKFSKCVIVGELDEY